MTRKIVIKTSRKPSVSEAIRRRTSQRQFVVPRAKAANMNLDITKVLKARGLIMVPRRGTRTKRRPNTAKE